MIILLDIDGVMVSAAGWKPPEILEDGFLAFTPKAVKALNDILERTNATIVLTTSHRDRYDEQQWASIFATRGIHAVINKCKSIPNIHASRFDLVMDWINENKDASNFVIIDDDTSLNGLPEPLKYKLILTSPLIGLNESLADEAIKSLVGVRR